MNFFWYMTNSCEDKKVAGDKIYRVGIVHVALYDLRQNRVNFLISHQIKTLLPIFMAITAKLF